MGEKSMNRLLLIDGSYYVYRSFFAMPNLCNQRGEPTGAIYGFVKSVIRMLRHIQPTHAAVIWDGNPKRRQEMQADYKQQRSERCEEMSAQWPVIEKIVPMMGLRQLRVENAESDDVMASYARTIYAGEDCGTEWECILATADKDLLACVGDTTRIYSTSKSDREFNDEFALLDACDVNAKWGVDPEQFGDMLALMGDESDNIKGVAGIGPKTAARLIRTHKTLDGIFASGDNTKGLQAEKERILQNREMIRLDDDLELPAPLEDLRIGEITPEFCDAMIACDIDVDKL